MTPDEFTLNELMLPIGDGHELYVQDWGNPQAKTPVIFLHGGPGGGCNDGHKGYFDPSKHRVIFFDQRGAGQSTPYGSLENNTTQDLVGDIDRISDHFKFEKVILCGRSWGSTLALCYGLHAPEKVQALVIGGIFLGDNAYENKLGTGYDWANAFFPDFIEEVSAKDYQALWQIAAKSNGEESKKAAYKITQTTQGRLDDRTYPIDYETFDPALIIIEAFYQANDWFLQAGHILENAHKLAMPVWLVQGRYDLVCPPRYAYDLDKKLPNSHLIFTQAGHSGYDRENWLATKTIFEQF